MSDEVTLRPACSADYDPACALLDSLDALHRLHAPWMFQAPETPARSRKLFEELMNGPDSAVVVAELGPQLVGIAHGVLRSAPELTVFIPQRWGVLDGLVVDSAWRRRGIGRRLTRSIETWALDRGAAWVELNVYEFNPEARRFYESLGYFPLSTKLRKPRTA